MKTLLVLLCLGNAADTATSLVAFSRGYGELNPLVVSTQPAPFIAEAAAATALEVWALHRIARHHPRLARGLALVQIGASTGVSINNARR